MSKLTELIKIVLYGIRAIRVRSSEVWLYIYYHYNVQNRIGGVMVSVLTSSAVDRGFELWSGQPKDYEIGICCFFAKHAALGRKSKDWLARNQDNVSQWGDMSIRGLLFQCWYSTQWSSSSYH